jgi:hypothetical protein
VGLVNETVGHPITLKSPAGVEIVADAASVRADASSVGHDEPRLFVGPQDKDRPTMRCYSVNSRPQERVVHEGTSSSVSQGTELQPLWSADWRLEAPGIVSFLKLPADKEAWKVLPAQTDVSAWQQVLAWFQPAWFRNVTPPKLLQPMRDLNGDGVEDLIWIAPRLINPQPGAFFLGPLTPQAPVLVAASGKDGQPLWWFRPQDSKGAACRLGTDPVWCGDAIVCVVRSVDNSESRIEAISPATGESLWQHNAGAVGTAWLTTAMIDAKPGVIAIIQDRLFALDAATGESRMGNPARLALDAAGKIVVEDEGGTGKSAHPTTVRLDDVRFVELDGDGVPEALLSVFIQDQLVDVVAVSVARREALWQVPSKSTAGPGDPLQGPFPWPFVADLDDDG